MKEIFKGAATRASCGMGPVHDFSVALLDKGMKPEMARLTLARKIAAMALTLWKKEERSLHRVIVIPIPTTDLLRFFRTLQFSADKAILRTSVGFNAQSAVGPLLSLAPEALRGLYPCAPAGGPNRTDPGNLPQQFRSFMFPALRQ